MSPFAALAHLFAEVIRAGWGISLQLNGRAGIRITDF
jgi:hypothetical protein